MYNGISVCTEPVWEGTTPFLIYTAYECCVTVLTVGRASTVTGKGQALRFKGQTLPISWTL